MKNKPAVVIPLDGSKTATVALGAAQAITNLIGGMLHIVHVTETPLSEGKILKSLKVDSVEVGDFIVHQVVGNVVDAILEHALSVGAKMIVMSSHGITYNPEHLLGSTAMGIIQRAPIPVMVIRPGMKRIPSAEWKPTKMLVPLEGTPESVLAMDQIFRMAEMLAVDIDALHIAVIGKKPSPEAGAITSPIYLDYPQFDWPAWTKEFMERFYVYHPPEAKLKLFHREGEPASVILAFASENIEDIVTLSWRGVLEKERAATVKAVLRRTEHPVVLIIELGRHYKTA